MTDASVEISVWEKDGEEFVHTAYNTKGCDRKILSLLIAGMARVSALLVRELDDVEPFMEVSE